MNKEQWKDIIGYEGLYQVSNLGKVKSLKWGKERIIKQGKNKDGYLLVNLCKDGAAKTFYVHRLVYEAFVGEIPEGMQINHLNENKENNALSNLNLMTAKENSNYGTRNERMAEKLKGVFNTKCSKEVIQLSLDGVEIARFLSTNEVQRTLGFAQSSVSRCCNGRYNQAYNYKWRYA